MFLGVTKKVKWKSKRKYNDHRDNAAVIIEFSNACPFRWKRGVFTCWCCPNTFGDFDDVRAHMTVHSDRLEGMKIARINDNIKIETTNLRCEICFATFNKLNDFIDHLVMVHEKSIILKYGLGVTPFLSANNEFICALCSERFALFSSLNSHMNQHYPNNICSHCGKTFAAQHRMKAHQLIHEARNKSYKCTKCEEVFESKSLKNYHLQNKHGSENRYRCPYCNESFKRYIDRLRHLKEIHDKTVEYPCHLCAAVFSLSDQRTKHIRNVHVKNTNYQCTFCSNKFVTAYHLKSHLVKHTGLKKFHCEVCKKSYARAKTLKEHLRIHNNDRRFVCEYCNNAFVQKCSLKSHIRTHHSNEEALERLT